MSSVARFVKRTGGGVGRGVFNSVKKVFKKVAASKVGRIALIAATIYFGGAALGYWNSGFATIDGALVGGASETAAAAGASKSAAPALLEGGTAAATESAAGGAAASGVAAGASQVPAATTIVQPAAAVAKPGIIGQAMGFVGKHPLASAIALNTAAGAFQPDQIDVLREQQSLAQQEDERRRRIAAENTGVGRINLGLTPMQPGILRDAFGNLVFDSRTGIIRRAQGAL